MAESRRVIKVFLASPGDLTDERRRAKAIADELNDLYAEAFDCQFHLIGWEDTVSVFGRPQSTINRELERCEIFIGLMWKKWGTPPSVNGPFTSGFEEEFRTTIERRRRYGRPEMSMFFKSISDDFLRDPGDQLKLVQAFRKELEQTKEILFQEFSDSDDFDKKFRACLARYQTTLLRETPLSDQDAQEPRDAGDTEKENATKQIENDNILSPEGLRFLKDFTNIVLSAKTFNDLSEADVARFRIINSIIGKPENDTAIVGPHDANLIYGNKESLSLGIAEKRALFNSGLHSFANENTPTWYWWAALNAAEGSRHIEHATLSREEVAAQAFKLMRYIGYILEDDKFLGRDLLTSLWFRDGTTDSMRIAALDYLADYGVPADIPQIRKEFNRNSTQTVASASKAIIQIYLRESGNSAVLAILDLRPSSLPEHITRSVFNASNGISDEQLAACLSIPNSGVRQHAATALLQRNKLLPESAMLLLSDDDAEVRAIAVSALSETPQAKSLEEAKKIIVAPRKGILFAHAQNDSYSEKAFENYKRKCLLKLPIDELRRLVDHDQLYDTSIYIALVERSFSKLSKEFRKNVDDRFSTWYDQRAAEHEKRFGRASKIAESTRQLKGFITERQTAAGILLLCGRKDSVDLFRIRSAIKDNIEVSASSLNSYLAECGEWSDIDLIADIVASEDRRRIMLIGRPQDVYRSAAIAVYKIGKNRFSDLIQHERLGQLLPYILAIATQASIRKISDKLLESLLSNTSALVRKVIAIRIISSLNRSRTSSIYKSYVINGGRFYNSIFWLDAGMTLNHEKIKNIETVALQDLK